jgi:hypothetical protein
MNVVVGVPASWNSVFYRLLLEHYHQSESRFTFFPLLAKGGGGGNRFGIVRCMCSAVVFHYTSPSRQIVSYTRYGGPQHAVVEGANVVNIFSFSKAFGMMGWRIGYLVNGNTASLMFSSLEQGHVRNGLPL